MPDSTVVTHAPATQERYLGTAEVCALFGGISPETAWRWVQKGWLPKPIRPHPTSRINLWPKSQIDAVLATRAQGGGSKPEAALAERKRRMANRKAGRTPIGGFKRGPRAP